MIFKNILLDVFNVKKKKKKKKEEESWGGNISWHNNMT
jgi:hypothetical protein